MPLPGEGWAFPGAFVMPKESAMSHLFSPRMLILYVIVSQAIALGLALLA